MIFTDYRGGSKESKIIIFSKSVFLNITAHSRKFKYLKLISGSNLPNNIFKVCIFLLERCVVLPFRAYAASYFIVSLKHFFKNKKVNIRNVSYFEIVFTNGLHSTFVMYSYFGSEGLYFSAPSIHDVSSISLFYNFVSIRKFWLGVKRHKLKS